MKRWLKILLISLAVIVVALGGYGVYYFTYSYKPVESLQNDLPSYNYVEHEQWIEFPSVNKDAPGIIIYQGARVDSYSYAYLAEQLQTKGYHVFISRMPGNWAFFNIDLAGTIIEQNPAISRWYLGGHSLGGSMAASYAVAHPEQEKLTGLFFLASYPAQDFSDRQLPMLFIFAEHDGLVTSEKQAQYLPNQSSSPENQVDMIAGGNHAQFGLYGVQDGDGTATIPAIQQQDEIVTDLDTWIKKVEQDVYEGSFE